MRSLTDPAEILDLIIHMPFSFTGPDDDPRDDPALVAGLVTSTEPDAEPVWLYNARSTADAHAALRARCRNRHRIIDPDGHLSGILDGLELDTDLYRRHREFSDTTRWNKIYGGLPLPRKERR